jgi:hypothetical protein
MTEKSPKPPESEIMNEQETLAFLIRNRAQQVSPANWQKGNALLCVMEDFFRGDVGPYKDLPKNKRPSIARLDQVDFIDFDHPKKDPATPNRLIYQIKSIGRVDYYVIDKNTGKPERIDRPDRINIGLPKLYFSNKTNIFLPKDDLFPRSK